MREFEYCLRCGQPLTSWLSRQSGFGLQCWEATPPIERRQLVTVAQAVQTDLELLRSEPRRRRPWRTLVDKLRLSRGARS